MKRKGFTLIELVVVLAIIGLLVGIVAPRVVRYIGTAQERSWKADQKAIQAAVDAYYTDEDNPRTYQGKRVYPTVNQNHADATTGASPDRTTDDPIVIKFNLSIFSELLPKIPRSAGNYTSDGLTAEANGVPAAGSGSYIWYVGPNGQVNAWHDVNNNGRFDTGEPLGFQQGVYP